MDQPTTKLKTDPIREAVLALVLKSPISKTVVAELAKDLASTYPIANDITTIQYPSMGSLIPETVSGLKLESDDHKSLIVLADRTVIFSRLSPYPGYTAFRQTAMTTFSCIQKRIPGENFIRRIGLRYINTLNLPTQPEYLGDYLSTPPALPKGASQKISEFISRVVLDLDQPMGGKCIITQALGNSQHDKYLPVILDVDVFLDSTDGLFPANDKLLWETTDQFKEIENRVFFASITKRTLEQYL